MIKIFESEALFYNHVINLPTITAIFKQYLTSFSVIMKAAMYQPTQPTSSVRPSPTRTSRSPRACAVRTFFLGFLINSVKTHDVYVLPTLYETNRDFTP